MVIHRRSEYDFTFTVVPLEYVKVKIYSEPITGIPVKVDGIEVGFTPVEIEVSPATYKIEVPSEFNRAKFLHWEDETTTPVREIEITYDIELTAFYEIPPISPWIVIAGIGIILIGAYVLEELRK